MNAPELLTSTMEDFQALMNFMYRYMRLSDTRLEKALFPMMKTWLHHRPMVIQVESKKADKAFFVAQGLVFAFFYNLDQEIVAFKIFRKGEIALIPESFMNGREATYSLMACAETRLMEISLTQVQQVYKDFPEAVMLALLIIADMFDKDVEKERMLSLGNKGSIRRFYEVYPELYGNSSYHFYDMYLARYLNMNPVTFSRLRSELYPNCPQCPGVD